MELLIKIIQMILGLMSKPSGPEESPDWYDANPPQDARPDPVVKKELRVDRDEYRCQCGCQKGVEITFEKAFETMLLFLQQKFPNKKIHCNSGHRCKKHNANEGGASNSMHLSFPVAAGDLWMEGVSARDMYRELDKQFPTSGLGFYLNTKKKTEFIHLDSRVQTARWVRIDGVYEKVSLQLLEKYGLR